MGTRLIKLLQQKREKKGSCLRKQGRLLAWVSCSPLKIAWGSQILFPILLKRHDSKDQREQFMFSESI
jgi:hypothetical protein